jgi:hypothetical protein
MFYLELPAKLSATISLCCKAIDDFYQQLDIASDILLQDAWPD